MADTIYIFTVASQGVFWQFCDWYTFSKGFTRRRFVRNNATHVVMSVSNIMTSLFDVVKRQFARDVIPKAHSIDFL